MKKFVSLILILCMVSPLTAFANSAPTHWRGSDANGIITGEENCPLVVENELLTFDIENVPQQYHSDISLFPGAKFTAEYTLHNPTDMEVTTKVLFPFGRKGDYYTGEFMTDSNFVNEYYSVAIDGEKVNADKRYTFFPFNYNEFDINHQLGSLLQDKSAGSEYKPDLKVTKYTINCGKEENDKILKLDWENNGEPCLLYTHDYHSGKFFDTSLTLTTEFYGEVIYYIIGDGDNRPQIGIFDKNEDNEYTGNGESVRDITTAEEMNLKQFVLSIYSGLEKMEIGEKDLNNIIVDIFRNISKGHEGRAFGDSLTFYNMPADLMCWYEYEITLPAGGTVVNTVTAPLFPDVQTNYEPDIYIYNYLLSPAGRWADFRGLEVVVNTPYFITESSVGEFEKTETGYKSTFDKLPDGELSFTLCENEKPEKERNYMYLMMFMPVIAIPVVVGIALILVIRYALKKKK